MKAHTPGPWIAADARDDSKPYRLIATVAMIGDWVVGRPFAVDHGVDYSEHAADEDDARLIAQAPALLEIAREYADSCAECGGTGTVQQYDTDDSDCAVTEFVDCPECAHVRAVIAAVEGAT